MAFQRTQAMTDIAFVPLQRVHQLGVTARDHPVRPLVVSSQPSQHVFLKVREADSRHPLRQPGAFPVHCRHVSPIMCRSVKRGQSQV